MQYRRLGTTDLNVSLIGLGTMTWGQQNTEAEAHAQMDYALAQGVNLWDAAEMYPVPPRAETTGLTETYIGTWLKSRGQRDRVILASKIAGPGPELKWIRNAETHFNAKHLTAAVEGSLRRLQTDYIDLYQLHWPDRNANFFGRLNYQHRDDDIGTPLLETLRVLDDLVRAGKIRHIGVSNETPWGVTTFLKLAEAQGLPRMASIQNPYSLVNRSFEIGLAEVAVREQCGLLAYSPLGMGLLSGKYEGGRVFPEGARLTLFSRFQRYQSKRGWAASEAYVAIARRHGLDPAQMALAFVNRQPFVTSNLIGATTLEQLRSNIASVDVALAPEVLQEIEAVHVDNPNPCP